MPRIDKAAYQRRLDRIGELLSDIVDHAGTVSRYRCPYRNRVDQCTAAFSCRNQQPPEEAGAPARCGHDGTFDYRSAWEADASAYAKAKARIGRTRSAAAERRSSGGSQKERG